MRIDRALNQALDEVAWWQNRLDQEEYADLQHSLAVAGGEAGMRDFDEVNSQAIAQLLEGTAKFREAQFQKAATTATVHAALLCCFRRARIAHFWLEHAHAQIERLEWSKPTRKTPAEVAASAMQFLAGLPPYWPYEPDED